MKKRILLLSLSAFATDLLASPFLTEKGKSKMTASVTSTEATELVRKSSAEEDRGNWSDDDFTINHQKLLLKVSHGVSEDMDFSLGFTYAKIANSGKWGPQQEDSEYSGLADVMISAKKKLYTEGALHVAGEFAFNGPASDYNPNVLVTPGIEAPEYVLGITNAYVHYDSNTVFGLDLAKAFRPGRAPDQMRMLMTVDFFGVELFTFGAHIGMVQSDSGVDLGDDDWVHYKTKGDKSTQDGGSDMGDEGHKGMPFARLNSAYQYMGLSASYDVSTAVVFLSYSQKMLSGARNTDINSNITLGCVYDL